ncbi:hypothetical protein HDU76_007974 [Blyttiomyces sp. JEL0837]|nr:hypothetical protein HDU76_007974 [Blyttiomyces sp. JEL0837]
MSGVSSSSSTPSAMAAATTNVGQSSVVASDVKKNNTLIHNNHHHNHHQQQQEHQLQQQLHLNIQPMQQQQPHPIPPQNNNSSAPVVPQKRTRSTRACDMCKKKRTKCSGNRIPCDQCMMFGYSCTYTAPQKKRGPPKRGEIRPQSTLQERVKSIEAFISGLNTGQGGDGGAPGTAIGSSSLSDDGDSSDGGDAMMEDGGGYQQTSQQQQQQQQHAQTVPPTTTTATTSSLGSGQEPTGVVKDSGSVSPPAPANIGIPGSVQNSSGCELQPGSQSVHQPEVQSGTRQVANVRRRRNDAPGSGMADAGVVGNSSGNGGSGSIGGAGTTTYSTSTIHRAFAGVDALAAAQAALGEVASGSSSFYGMDSSAMGHNVLGRGHTGFTPPPPPVQHAGFPHSQHFHQPMSTAGSTAVTAPNLPHSSSSGSTSMPPPPPRNPSSTSKSSATAPASTSAATTSTSLSSAAASTSLISTLESSHEVLNSAPGFRGIALSLQRKMRRGLRPAHVVRSGSDDPTDPNNDEQAGTPPSTTDLVTHQINNDSGEITIVEDLASDTILFYGSTSTTTSSAWRQSPRFAGGIMSISLSFEATTPSVDTGPVDFAPPCSGELVMHLCRVYFEHVHPYFPMVDRASFARQLKEKRTEHFALLLNSICALVTQQCRDLTAWGVPSASNLHNAFFERARVLLGRQFDWPHINNVQALLLLCMVGQGTNINASSYHYIGIAHRQAVELGMHRNLDNMQHPRLDEGLRQSMRATWFCLYILDRYTSVVEGRPMAICDEEWDTPFPSGDAEELSMLKFHVGLVEILGRIANYVNRPGRPGRPQWHPGLAPPPIDSKKIINEINAQLAAWLASVPVSLSTRPLPGARWSFHHHLFAMFHTATVLLHRLDVGQFDQTCHINASEISRVLEALPADVGGGGIGGGSGNSDTSSAGFVFVIPLIRATDLKNPHGSGSRTPSLQFVGADELRRSLVAFERLRDTSLFASYYGQLIVEVLKSNGISIEGVTEEEGAASAGAGADAGVADGTQAEEQFAHAHHDQQQQGGPVYGHGHMGEGVDDVVITESQRGGHVQTHGSEFYPGVDVAGYSGIPPQQRGGVGYGGVGITAAAHAHAHAQALAQQQQQAQAQAGNFYQARQGSGAGWGGVDPGIGMGDPGLRLRAAARAQVAAVQAAQAAAAERARRLGIPFAGLGNSNNVVGGGDIARQGGAPSAPARGANNPVSTTSNMGPGGAGRSTASKGKGVATSANTTTGSSVTPVSTPPRNQGGGSGGAGANAAFQAATLMASSFPSWVGGIPSWLRQQAKSPAPPSTGESMVGNSNGGGGGVGGSGDKASGSTSSSSGPSPQSSFSGLASRGLGAIDPASVSAFAKLFNMSRLVPGWVNAAGAGFGSFGRDAFGGAGGAGAGGDVGNVGAGGEFGHGDSGMGDNGARDMDIAEHGGFMQDGGLNGYQQQQQQQQVQQQNDPFGGGAQELQHSGLSPFSSMFPSPGSLFLAPGGPGEPSPSALGNSPFFADSIFSDLLNPLVEPAAIFQELGAIMGTGGVFGRRRNGAAASNAGGGGGGEGGSGN